MRIITFLICLLIGTAYANMPTYLKDGEITVKLKNGKEYKFSSNEYMVVKREFKIVNTELMDKPGAIITNVPTLFPKKRHIISGMAGFSRHDLDSFVSSNRVTTKNDLDFDFGVQYQYEVHPNIYLNILGTINETGLVGVGFGF